jgi:hypothetical protein
MSGASTAGVGQAGGLIQTPSRVAARVEAAPEVDITPNAFIPEQMWKQIGIALAPAINVKPIFGRPYQNELRVARGVEWARAQKASSGPRSRPTAVC